MSMRLQITAEHLLRAWLIRLVCGGQPEPLDFLIYPTELCLFGFCKTLKCFGKYTVKACDVNICNRKYSGNQAPSLEFFQAEHN